MCDFELENGNYVIGLKHHSDIRAEFIAEMIIGTYSVQHMSISELKK